MSWLVDVVDWFTNGANWRGPEGVPTRLVEHLELTALSVTIACLLALPLALWLGHIGRGGALAINVTNIGRAVPTFAVLVILAVGPLGIGQAATVTALVLFAIPPVLTNAYVGMREVDADIVEAAGGMGMGAGQVLRRVEIPLAAPLIMAGIRLSAVQVVATATLAAVVAGGGLGRIITAGLGRQNQAQVVAGAILVAALALVVELSLGWVQRRVDPKRRAARRGRRAAGGDGGNGRDDGDGTPYERTSLSAATPGGD